MLLCGKILSHKWNRRGRLILYLIETTRTSLTKGNIQMPHFDTQGEEPELLCSLHTGLGGEEFVPGCQLQHLLIQVTVYQVTRSLIGWVMHMLW